MSIYIPVMEMPESCRKCRIEQGDSGYWWCGAVKKFKPTQDFRESRPEWCPLVPVPEHGRLGDLGEVINDVRHYLCEDCSGYIGPDAKTESCDYCSVTRLIKTIEQKSSIIPPVMEYPQVPGITPTVIAEEGEVNSI